MLDLAGGIVPVPTGVAVTKAVALQVYLLFQQQRLKHLAFKHVYLVLASFSLGYRVNSAQTAAVERLRRFFSSREGGARVGLAEDYKERIYKRSRDEMLKQLTVPAAPTGLLCTDSVGPTALSKRCKFFCLRFRGFFFAHSPPPYPNLLF